MEQRISDKNTLNCIVQRENVRFWTLYFWLTTGLNGGFFKVCAVSDVCDLRPNGQCDKCFDSCLIRLYILEFFLVVVPRVSRKRSFA